MIATPTSSRCTSRAKHDQQHRHLWFWLITMRVQNESEFQIFKSNNAMSRSRNGFTGTSREFQPSRNECRYTCTMCGIRIANELNLTIRGVTNQDLAFVHASQPNHLKRFRILERCNRNNSTPEQLTTFFPHVLYGVFSPPQNTSGCPDRAIARKLRGTRLTHGIATLSCSSRGA
jgi:hypothetical protein